MITSREELYKNVLEVICDVIDISKDQIKPESRFIEDLGADSIEIAEMIMHIEERMDKHVNKTGLLDVQTVNETVTAFEKYMDVNEN